MKIVAWIVGTVGFLLTSIYILIFTPFGNGLIAPTIQEKIQAQTKLDSKLDIYRLSLSDFEIFITLNQNNTISIKGDYSLFSQSMNVVYKVNLEELKTLKELLQAELDMPLHLNGTVIGDAALLVVDGESDIASSKTTFRAELINFAPSKVTADIKGLVIQEVLAVLKQPHYTDGLFDLNINITNADVNNLDGMINSKIYKGKLDSKYLTKTYGFKSMMPRTTFNATTSSKLSKDVVDTKIDFNSNLVNLDIKSAKFNISQKSLDTDYKVKIHNLDRLFFVSGRHLKGKITANGRMKKDKDLDFSIFSNIADGKLIAKLHNDDFTATLKGMQTLKVLDMLLYPKIFKSLINADVKYNLAEAKGVFDGKLSQGKFTRNQVLDLAKQYAGTNMYKETFKGDVSAKINKEKIIALLDLKSNRSAITTKNTKLDTKKNTIDSEIKINANGNPIGVKLSGDVNKPKVDIDAQELIKKEATKAIRKEVNKFFKGLF
ncbi:hypothetical protein JHD49_07960 [Sulfurimonas sp. SAG-AH-194-C21]|nr:hypothetical protein [Sulfurimonas sp. SAG-AH-194-C21]MDF1883867.1 hypothetical protein [Sulfurimonas sp. SAG-AH-194-C21]